MSEVKPNVLFEVWRADEVAECLQGIDSMEDPLYLKLWNEIVPLQDGPNPNIEDCGPEIGDDTLSAFWDRLTEAEQLRLNDLAKAHNARWEID